MQASEVDVVSRELFDKMLSQRMVAYVAQLDMEGSMQEKGEVPEDLQLLLQEF